MNKADLKIVVDEFREGKSYPETDISPLSGCGLPNFPLKKVVRKEVIVMHLRWQAMYLNGKTDEEELSSCLQILKDKKVIMV